MVFFSGQQKKALNWQFSWGFQFYEDFRTVRCEKREESTRKYKKKLWVDFTNTNFLLFQMAKHHWGWPVITVEMKKACFGKLSQLEWLFQRKSSCISSHFTQQKEGPKQKFQLFLINYFLFIAQTGYVRKCFIISWGHLSSAPFDQVEVDGSLKLKRKL